MIVKGSQTVGPNGERNEMNPILDGLVHRRQDIGIIAPLFPADLVGRDSSLDRHPSSLAFSVLEESGGGDHRPGSRGRCVGPMPFSISRRFRLFRLVYWPVLGFVPLVEGTSSDDLAITGRRREMGAHLAGAPPSGRNGIISVIGEAPDIGPNAGVENADDDVGGVIGVGPQPIGIGEAQEVGGASGMEVPGLVWDHGEDGGVAEELSGVDVGEVGGEAGGGVGVGVEEVGG